MYLEDRFTNVIVVYLFLVVLYVVHNICRSPITSGCKGCIDGYCFCLGFAQPLLKKFAPGGTALTEAIMPPFFF